MHMQNNNAQHLPLARVLLCGGAVVTLSMGIRHGFGLWLQPITQDMGWTRESFALALAIQNLSWGLIGIFTGMLADRFGATKVLIAGGYRLDWVQVVDQFRWSAHVELVGRFSR